MHFHVGNGGVRHAADDMRPKLRDDAVHDGLRDTIEPVLDELLLIWMEAEAILRCVEMKDYVSGRSKKVCL